MNRTGPKPRYPAPEGFWGCSSCAQIKPLAEFPLQQGKRNGHSSRCRACKSAWSREYRPLMRTYAAVDTSLAFEFQRDPTDQERAYFEAKVNKDAMGTGCWEWMGALRFAATKARSRAYGAFWFDKKVHYAHRVAWHFNGGEQPTHLVIDHICMNGRCVNPDHLRVVTRRMNSLENRRPRSRKAA